MSQLHFPIPAYSPPTEFFCVFKAFEADKIDQILADIDKMQFYARSRGGLNQGTIGKGEVNEAIRKSKVLMLDVNQDTEWLFHHIAHIVGVVNYDKFGMDLDMIEALQYTEYGPTKDHYSDHVDCHQNEVRSLHRKLSMTVMLTDPSEYEGGDLVINVHGDPNSAVRLRPKKGEAVFFYSHLPHRVEAVTGGKRISLVSWFLGPKIR